MLYCAALDPLAGLCQSLAELVDNSINASLDLADSIKIDLRLFSPAIGSLNALDVHVCFCNALFCLF